MRKFELGEKYCWTEQLGSSDQPLPLVILLSGDDGMQQLSEIREMLLPRIEAGKCRPFLITGFGPIEWNRDFSPWYLEDTGGRIFAGKADETLGFLENTLLPALRSLFSLNGEVYPVGYSLGGLAALYGHCLLGFRGCGSCSGSLWFPGWLEFLQKHPPAGKVYLSLGGKEEKTKDPLMCEVGIATQRSKELIAKSAKVTYVKEPGGHFREIPQRIGRAILWLLNP
ncbi:alpha/beta hydrolase-fold protein [Desulfosporosinus sp. PR]|uniref:alpha/beta hydrolase-fold protein n=1 Tax=Candidatus Desulfosporosinus nitrosoreducens TaxID=3401928 RepID=UPI0027F6152C|nr:alpha/beta hydrolase-fold protein [Desulfosporosinus sp. PR]MDQ7096700.1 alpha/beta hydrolase-fold protein [Desulfosporosinus sp. PR]